MFTNIHQQVILFRITNYCLFISTQLLLQFLWSLTENIFCTIPFNITKRHSYIYQSKSWWILKKENPITKYNYNNNINIRFNNFIKKINN